jgi:anthranilate synthase/indole-3-glycerol phosphate synthase/phosphoribosylanthranilate isomerase
MAPLVEVSDAAEMQIALDLSAKVIGPNNRYLRDFGVDMETASRLVDMALESQNGVVLCALKWISMREDVEADRNQGGGCGVGWGGVDESA